MGVTEDDDLSRMPAKEIEGSPLELHLANGDMKDKQIEPGPCGHPELKRD